MIIKFDTTDEIREYREVVLGLPPEGPLPAMLRILATNNQQQDTVEIQLHREICPKGYRMNPTMLGNNSQSEHFTACQGRKRDAYIVVTYSKQDKPQLFKQLTQFCENAEMEEIAFRAEDVPTSYRENNALLAYRLREATGVDVLITYDDAEKSYTFRKKGVDSSAAV